MAGMAGAAERSEFAGEAMWCPLARIVRIPRQMVDLRG